MQVAVMGGSGFIGSSLVRRLQKEGHDVLVLDIVKGTAGGDFQYMDIRQLDQVMSALTDADVVYHLAGTVLGTARKNPYLAVQLDVHGTANVLEACIKNGVKKLLYASSFYVYDGLPPTMEVDESTHSDIFDAEMFGVVKLMGERLVKDYSRKYGLKYVLFRYGPVYGPHERCSCVVYEFIRDGLAGKSLLVWGKGERKNQYTYVEDIADGCTRGLSFENEVFNLISPQHITIKETAELLSKKYGFSVTYDLTKTEGPSVPYISPKKAMDKLGWNPTSLENGIETMVSELRKSHVR
jgi:UDP-glucose 4-epimerase